MCEVAPALHRETIRTFNVAFYADSDNKQAVGPRALHPQPQAAGQSYHLQWGWFRIRPTEAGRHPGQILRSRAWARRPPIRLRSMGGISSTRQPCEVLYRPTPRTLQREPRFPSRCQHVRLTEEHPAQRVRPWTRQHSGVLSKVG